MGARRQASRACTPRSPRSRTTSRSSRRLACWADRRWMCYPGVVNPESSFGSELTAVELHAILRLRVDVFVVEQKAAYPEIDGRDLLPTTRHIWLCQGELGD